MTNEKSTRALLKEWVTERIDGADEVQIPVLVEEAMRHFLADQGFVSRFFKENVRALVYDFVQSAIANSRGELVSLGDNVVNRETFKQKARKRSVFATWMEHVGDRHVQLLEMTREDLLIAAKERSERAATEQSIARLWRAMAQKLEGGQVVKEVFTVEQIEHLQTTIKKAPKTGAA